MKVLYTGQLRNGTPVPDLIKMVGYNHPKVKFIPYTKKTKGDVILGINRIIKDDRDIPQVLYMGSVPSFRKSRYKDQLELVDHAFFISDYCRKIFLSKWEFDSHSVFLPFGSLPYDDNMEPLEGKRSIDGPIQFVSVAKWYKRPYKRLNHILRLYHDHLKKEYPDSILNIIGSPRDMKKEGVHYYKKSFHNDNVVDLFKKCHVHIIPTPFDTGPKTIPESLHYKVPFVCSNNCTGIEYINLLGSCGIEVKTDDQIDSMNKYKICDPLNGKSEFTKKQIPYKDYVKAIKEIIDNFEEYTSWEWNNKLNYRDQSDNLYNMLKGK